MSLTPNKMNMKKELSHAYVINKLFYDPSTGYLYRRWKDGRVGKKEIGGLTTSGHRHVMVDGISMYAHRLVWLYAYGCIPDLDIDHINGNGDDNRLENLRLCTHAQNMQNRIANRNSSSRYIGVSIHRTTGKWVSQIMVHGIGRYLGLHETEELAHKAYLEEKKRLHKFNPVQREVDSASWS